MSESLSKLLQLQRSPRECLGHCITWGKSLWSVPGSHTATRFSHLGLSGMPQLPWPPRMLKHRRWLRQIHTLLKAAWMQWHWTSSGWLEPNPQKCLRSCESSQALSPALSCMPLSNSEQLWSLLVPAWPAANQVSCTSGISPGTVQAPEDSLLSSECFVKSSFMWEAPLDVFKVHSTHHTGDLG